MPLRKLLRALPAAGMLLAFICSGCPAKEEPKPAEPKRTFQLYENQNMPAFSGENAYQFTAAQVAFGPRVPNSDAHKKAREWFITEFNKYADTVATQDFNYPGYDNERLALSNIIARFNPGAKDRIFFCAHWDSRPRADRDPDSSKHALPIPGANDGASGCGVLLELARLLKGQKPDYGIDIILFDGEDYGKEHDLSLYCIGSKYFAATAGENYKPAFGILLDMVGDKDAVFKVEENSLLYAGDIVAMVWDIARRVNAMPPFSDAQGGAVYDDHIPLNQAGLKTIDIIDADLIGGDKNSNRREYWHTTKDDMKNISKEALQATGNVLAYLVSSLTFENVKR